MRVIRVAVLAALLSLLVASSAGALDIDTEVSLPDALVGTPYSFQFTGQEGCLPYHFAYKAGTVPGLTITDDGLLAGTPTTAGAFTFWVELRDSVDCNSPASQGQYTLIVSPRIEITAATLPSAKVGTAYNAAVTATGGGSLAWSVSAGALPPGLALNRDSGALTGTPSDVGSFPFTVTVRDDKRVATQQYTVVVATPLTVSATRLPVGEVGVPFRASVPSSGGIGPLHWSGTPPSGLALDSAQGVIQGTPAAAGSFTLLLTITDSDGQTVNATATFTIAARLAITSTQAAKATVGKRYRLQLATRGGVAPRSWMVVGGKLPAGITLNRTIGMLTGTPRDSGTYRITIKLRDKLGATTTRVLTLTVAAG